LYAAIAVALSVGCGQGPSSHTVSGNVTHQGRPVPRGEISFEPDTSQGETGPACVANIINGTYQTSPGKGTQGGKHRVRIIHLPAENESLGTVEPLWFSPYEIAIELPKADSRQDFEIHR
jgi:hypothetical protein